LRERILAVAGELFYQRGVHAVGRAEIVEKVGCGKNAEYRVFPSKANLIAAYLAEFVAQRDAQIAAALAGLERQPAALEAYVAEAVAQSHDPRWTGWAMRNYVREARLVMTRPVRSRGSASLTPVPSSPASSTSWT
jgi:AcrR family transcriptional regulator